MAEDPVAQYKEVLGMVGEATLRMSEYESRQAMRLSDEVTDAKRAVSEATDVESKVSKEITAWWQQVRSRLSNLRWIIPGPLPTPEPDADPQRLNEYLSQVEPATDDLLGAIRKASRGGRF
jgi:hypothetical protein